MRIRRILFLVLLGAAVATVLQRLRQRGQQARVDVYLADGSLTSLGSDVPEGAFLLSLARDVRSAA
jgi:hypothetical protein